MKPLGVLKPAGLHISSKYISMEGCRPGHLEVCRTDWRLAVRALLICLLQSPTALQAVSKLTLSARLLLTLQVARGASTIEIRSIKTPPVPVEGQWALFVWNPCRGID